MSYEFSTTIHKEGNWYVAQAIELGVASQGNTVEEAKKNLIEAVELYLEDEDPTTIPHFEEEPILTRIKVRGGQKTTLR